MPEGVLLVFHLPEGSPPTRHRTFHRRIYGMETSSWGGRYQYHLKGALEDIPHVRLYWGVVIVTEEDGSRTTRLLREQGAEVVTRRILLTKSDQGKLRG